MNAKSQKLNQIHLHWEQALEGKTLKDLLNLAFKDTYIDTLDHPILKELWLSE